MSMRPLIIRAFRVALRGVSYGLTGGAWSVATVPGVTFAIPAAVGFAWGEVLAVALAGAAGVEADCGGGTR